jgi:hypothetical protein
MTPSHKAMNDLIRGKIATPSQPPQVPTANSARAGNGTATPPSPKRDMNDFIRYSTGHYYKG